MQRLQSALVALHVRELFGIAVTLKLGNCPGQRLLIRIAASPCEGRGLHERPPFPGVEEQRRCAEMLRQTVAAARAGIRDYGYTAGAEGVNIAVD
ncbi:hypothetical protein D3C85_1596920 [compost metagenome]